MQTTGRMVFATLGAAFLAGAGLVGTAGAHDGHDHGGAQHGGAEAKTKHYHFEAVFTAGGVKLYAHGADHEAVDARKLSATATFYHPNTPDKPWFSRALRPAQASPGQAAGSLDLAVDLRQVPPTGATALFRVSGLPDAAESTAEFRVPIALAASTDITVTKATQADQAAIKVQKVCKVSDEELGSMGVPLKVTRGDKSILICCQGCVKAIKADPDKFFGAPATAPAAKRGEHDHHDHKP